MEEVWNVSEEIGGRGRCPGFLRNRVVARLPEMPGSAAAHIEEAGVIGLQPAQHLGRSALMGGNRYQVELIGHQAVAPDRQTILLRVTRQQVQEHRAVLIAIEYIGAPVAWLGDVVG